MNELDYPVVLIYSEDEGAWLARVDQLPGLIVDGATMEEALQKVRPAVVDWIETTKELGRPVPPPFSNESLLVAQAEIAKQQNEMLMVAFNHAVAAAAGNPKGVVYGAAETWRSTAMTGPRFDLGDLVTK